MQRVCFRLKVKKDCLTQYKDSQMAFWPEMLDALYESGWRNYSLFLADDGLLIGYFETADQADVAHMFEGLGAQKPSERFDFLQQVFFLP